MANNLQLYRNSIVLSSKEDAINSLIEEMLKSSDGEMVLSRYENENGEVETIFGIAYSGEEKTSYTIFEKSPKVGISDDYETVNIPELSETSFTYEKVVGGDTIDIAVKKIESGLVNLLAETLKNEYVISQALTKLNDSAGFDSKGEYEPLNADFLNGVDNLSDAINELARQIVKNSEDTEILKKGIDCGPF